MKRILYSLLALWLVLSCEETRLPSLVEWCPSIDESALGDVPRPDSYKITVSNIGTEAVEEMGAQSGQVSASDGGAQGLPESAGEAEV